MIKIIPDANIIISGMITPNGATRKIIDLAYTKRIILYGTDKTYKEFCEKIKLKRFQKYLKKQYFSPEKIMLDYHSFIDMINPFDILKDQNIVTTDPDDNKYLIAAVASNSKIILSRDKHLLDIKKYEDITIVKPERFLKSWYKLNKGKLF